MQFESEQEQRAFRVYAGERGHEVKQESRNGSIRNGDAPYFEQLISDDRNHMEEGTAQPGKESRFSIAFHEIMAGSPRAVFFNRRVVDGEGAIVWVRE
eukprot:6733780-Lingulodinium_polyedra.AAC.1